MGKLESTPNLVAEALSETRQLQRRPCTVHTEAERVPALAGDIFAVIANRDISEGAAERVFNKHGIRIAAITIGRHRRNQCSYCKDAD